MDDIRPIFILAPPRCFTSITCAMLGQHPPMYGLPETHLFATESLAPRPPGTPQKAVRCRHGLIRAVAELYFGEQTEKSVRQAGGWLRRRLHVNTGLLFELLARRVCPRMPVEKSPDVVYQMNALERIRE